MQRTVYYDKRNSRVYHLQNKIWKLFFVRFLAGNGTVPAATGRPRVSARVRSFRRHTCCSPRTSRTRQRITARRPTKTRSKTVSSWNSPRLQRHPNWLRHLQTQEQHVVAHRPLLRLWRPRLRRRNVESLQKPTRIWPFVPRSSPRWKPWTTRGRFSIRWI